MKKLRKSWAGGRNTDILPVVSECWSKWQLISEQPPQIPLPERLSLEDKLYLASALILASNSATHWSQRGMKLWAEAIATVRQPRVGDEAFKVGTLLCNRLMNLDDVDLSDGARIESILATLETRVPYALPREFRSLKRKFYGRYYTSTTSLGKVLQFHKA